MTDEGETLSDLDDEQLGQDLEDAVAEGWLQVSGTTDVGEPLVGLSPKGRVWVETAKATAAAPR